MITWFKELITLVKMIFNKVDVNKEIEIMQMNNFPFEGYSYMMWCGNIVTRKKSLDIPDTTYNHERGHLIQASHYGRWIIFYLVYLWEWIKGDPVVAPSSGAYYTIPFEMQTYANEDNPDYDYNVVDLKTKYTIKNRKSAYIEHRFNWIEWIKSL